MKIRSKSEPLISYLRKKENLAFLWDHLRDMTIPVVKLLRCFRRKINKGRKVKVLYAVVTEWKVCKNEEIVVNGKLESLLH